MSSGNRSYDYSFRFRVWDFRRIQSIEDLSNSRPHAPDEVPIEFRATEYLKIKKPIGDDYRQVSVAQARSRTRSKTFWVPKGVALLSDGGASMLSLLSDVGAPAEHQEAVSRDISSAAAARSVGMGTSPIVVTFQHTTLVVVEDDDDDESDDMMDMGLRESMAVDVARPIPATRSAIEGLEKVTFEDGLQSIGQCIICTEEFEGGLELTRLPCSHVYHGDCIVKWLEKSHRCPLCRYPLPYVRLIFACPFSCIFIDPRSYKSSFKCIAKNSSGEAIAKSKREGLYIDKRGKWRGFNPKKLSRQRSNAKLFTHIYVLQSIQIFDASSFYRWLFKYGSGFVDKISSIEPHCLVNFVVYTE